MWRWVTNFTPSCLNRRLGRPESQSGHFGEEKSLAAARIWTSDHPACSLVTIPRTLHWLPADEEYNISSILWENSNIGCSVQCILCFVCVNLVSLVWLWKQLLPVVENSDLQGFCNKLMSGTFDMVCNTRSSEYIDRRITNCCKMMGVNQTSRMWHQYCF
jgi:hypothetical protein